MLRLAGLPLGKYRGMLHQPELVDGIGRALAGEIAHRLPDTGVIALAEVDNLQGQTAQITSPS